MPRSATLTAVGGDIFAGMFTRGVIDAGFDVPVHLEHNNYGVKSAQLNFPGLEVRFPQESWRAASLRGADFMFTNPPCAPWSMAMRGQNKVWSADPRLSCITTLRDAGGAVQPKAWAWESVTSAWLRGREFVEAQARWWMEREYHVTVLLQNNMFLGAPQNRKRMFFIAHRHELIWPALTKPMTVRQALAKVKGRTLLRQLKPAEVELWEGAAAPGCAGKLHKALSAMTPKQQARVGKAWRRPSFLCRRLELDQPSPVYFHGYAYHPTEPRQLSYEEALALCGLPAGWQLEGKLSPEAVGGYLSRGVLAPVGKWLATAVRDGLAEKPLRGAPRFKLVNALHGELREEVLS